MMISNIQMMTIMMILCFIKLSDGQTCTDFVDIHQRGRRELGSARYGILPRLNFTCDGRITVIMTRIRNITIRDPDRYDYPYFQVWRPSSTNSMVYMSIGEVQLRESQVSQCNSDGYCIANIVLTGNDRIEFQSGDVVGWYTTPDARYGMMTILTDGYVIYFRLRYSSTPLTSANLNDTQYSVSDRFQPLIQFMIDLRCSDLPNTVISSCNSDTGAGYEGDTCNFTCNTGYELTSNEARTCQSDGNWSGTGSMCRKVSCNALTDPENGIVTCSSTTSVFQDTCMYYCDHGYQLDGSRQTSCAADGTWSSEPVTCTILTCNDPEVEIANSQSVGDCSRTYGSRCSLNCSNGYIASGNGEHVCDDVNSDGTLVMWRSVRDTFICSIVSCNALTDPENGNVTCSSTTNVFQDTCTYYCDHGYQLDGARQTSCAADGTWSSEPVTCTILTCNDPEVEIANSQSVGDCSTTYGSSCVLNCSNGYIASGNGEHVCDDVNSDGTLVMWKSVGDTFVCTSSGNKTDGSRPTSEIISGLIGGGAVLILVIIVLCIAVLFVRWLYKKTNPSTYKDNSSNKNSTATLSVVNLAYSSTIPNANVYDYINNDQLVIPNLHHKQDMNNSHGSSNSGNSGEHDENMLGSNVTIQPNPCYSEAKQYRKSGREQYCPNNINPISGHTDDYIEMENNPSLTNWRINTECQNSDVKMTSNPSYAVM